MANFNMDSLTQDLDLENCDCDMTDVNLESIFSYDESNDLLPTSKDMKEEDKPIFDILEF